MSKVFASLPGVALSKEEDERLHLWKHLQNHSRNIVSNAITMVAAKSEIEREAAQNKLYDAVTNYLRLGGKVEDIKHFL